MAAAFQKRRHVIACRLMYQTGPTNEKLASTTGFRVHQGTTLLLSYTTLSCAARYFQEIMTLRYKPRYIIQGACLPTLACKV